LAGPADAIFAMPPGDVGLVAAWTGLVLYTLQIYCDFSGYSDMAIGMGRMFGFHFPENFDHPYAARSVTEFWRRWHISLSTWFRDYLYIPLGGNRRGPLRTYGNLMAVFVLCGLWHGASWTFVLWGLWHGLFLAAERAAGPRLDRVPAPLRHAVTMLAVMLGWVLFRAPDAASAGRYVASLVGAHGLVGAAGWRAYADPALGLFVVVGIACSLPVGRAVHAAVARIVAGGRSALPRHAYAVARLAALGCVFWASAALLFAQTYNPFIYFRF
jgi:alginate O-acetyltransferase complex protein AlgI